MGLFSFIKDIVTSFNPISFLINTAISWAIGEIVKDDLEQELDAKYSGTLVNKSSNIAQIPVIYGERKVGGVRSFVATSGNDNQYLYMVLAICEGEVDSIGDIYINDVISTDSKYSGLVSITKYTGTDTQTADSTLVNANIGWTSAHRLRGVAYLAIRLKWDNNVFGGIPTFHAVVRGRKVYDPATNTTAWSDNPALCLRDYLTNTRYGKGLSSAAIDDTLFNAAKTKCDTSVTPYANGTARALFSCNAVLDTSKTLMSNVKVLLSGMRGIMPYQQGKYGLIIEDQGNASFDFTEDHIIGSLTIQSEQKNSKYNRVIATFANPDANWQMDEIEYPAAGSSEESGYLTADGVELIGRIDLPTITDIYTAEDIAEITLKRSRNALSVGFNATSEALNCAVGDIVSVTHSTPSWDEKTFRVTSLSLNADGTVGVELVEHQDSIYPWTQKTEKDDIPDTNLPDPFITAPVTNLSVVPRALDTFDGTIVSVLDITWTASVDQFVSQYEVTITPSSGDAAVVVTSNTNHRFQVLDINATYVVSVKPINAMGVYGASVGSSSITPVADTTAPSAPTNPNVTGTFKKIILDWDNPTDSDFSYIEIKRSNDSQEVNATIIGKTSATQFIDEPYTGNTTRYFWIRAVDTSGNASAWVSMGSGTSIRIDVGDFDDGVISPDFINQDFTNIIDGKATQADLDTEVARIDTFVAEQQDMGNTFDTIAERMLTLATTQSDTLGTIANAGITVDPNTGAVSIQAVEALRTDTDNAINSVQVDLDAAEAQINLKASTSYVNNAIASAVLDSADLASLNALEATVDQVEIDLDAAEAAILLKADTTTVSGLDVRIGQAELDIDAAESAINLKASTSDLNSVESRVTTAETTISALDVAAISNAVIDTRNISNKLDTSSITNLKQLIDAHKNRDIINQEIAFARQEISADVRDNNEAVATAKTELSALINQNTSLIQSEQTTRANADSAIASDVTTLTAIVNDNSSQITNEQTARADADSALASDITALTASINDSETGLAATATGLTNLTSTVENQGNTISAQSSTLTALNTTVGNNSTSITEATNSINGIKAQYSVTVDNNGHVSGFGLVSDIIDGNPTSAFIIDADQFAIGSNGNYPFVYYANQTTVTKDGVDYDLAAGVYLQDVHIQKGAITDAHVGSLTAESITVASLDGLSTDLGTITAGKLENSDSSFVIDLTNKTLYIR
jgi:hypothetical protein